MFDSISVRKSQLTATSQCRISLATWENSRTKPRYWGLTTNRFIGLTKSIFSLTNLSSGHVILKHKWRSRPHKSLQASNHWPFLRNLRGNQILWIEPSGPSNIFVPNSRQRSPCNDHFITYTVNMTTKTLRVIIYIKSHTQYGILCVQSSVIAVSTSIH